MQLSFGQLHVYPCCFKLLMLLRILHSAAVNRSRLIVHSCYELNTCLDTLLSVYEPHALSALSQWVFNTAQVIHTSAFHAHAST